MTDTAATEFAYIPLLRRTTQTSKLRTLSCSNWASCPFIPGYRKYGDILTTIPLGMLRVCILNYSVKSL
jgi:hypothetical protein